MLPSLYDINPRGLGSANLLHRHRSRLATSTSVGILLAPMQRRTAAGKWPIRDIRTRTGRDRAQFRRPRSMPDEAAGSLNRAYQPWPPEFPTQLPMRRALANTV